MLKLVVLVLVLATLMMAQTKLQPQWTDACASSECVVSP
jgi:hypothetical protein